MEYLAGRGDYYSSELNYLATSLRAHCLPGVVLGAEERDEYKNPSLLGAYGLAGGKDTK